MLKVDALDRLKELLYYGNDAVEPRNLGALVGVQQAALKVCDNCLNKFQTVCKVQRNRTVKLLYIVKLNRTVKQNLRSTAKAGVLT
jgi:hypothetical protein